MIDYHAIPITPEILNLIAEIDEFKGAWHYAGKIAPEKLKALKKNATIQSVGSSTRIEGVQLTDNEVEKLLMGIENHILETRDEQEVAGYAFVSEEIFNHFESMPFTENTIKHWHAWLLKYSIKDQRHKGEYKKISNNIEACDEKGKSLGTLFEITSPFETPFKMSELVENTKEALESKIIHPLIVIGIFIVIFLAIHPFQDGNGRLSRCLTTLLLLQNGYTYVPFTSLERIIEKNKEKYYLALRQTQQSWKNGQVDFLPWLHFFLQALVEQKTSLEKKIEREKSLGVAPPAAKIIQLLEEHGSLTIKDLQLFTGLNRNTLKKQLHSLVEQRLIILNGKGKGSWYSL